MAKVERTTRSHRLGGRGGTTTSTGLGRNDLDRAVKWKEGAANSTRVRRGGGVGKLNRMGR